MLATAKVTSKGQLTLPRAARTALDSSTVEIEVQGNMVILRPVKSVAGSLNGYAVPAAPLHEIREKVWKDVAHGKGS